MQTPQEKELCREITVPIEGEGLRLDQFLGAQNIFKNRSQALKIIQKGKVLLRGKKPLKPSSQLKEGDVLKIHLPPDFSAEGKKLRPYDFPVPTVYEDEDVLVVEKPAGLVTHPAPGHSGDTLVNALVHQKKQLSSGSDRLRPGLVHRLDKDTGGLLVLAKNKFSEERLIQQFKNRSIKRVYWGVTFRSPARRTGKMESYLTRSLKDRKRFISLPEPPEEGRQAKRAVTNYRVLRQHESCLTWMEYVLETGRTHQIRVQSAFFGFPLVGDKIYGSRNEKNLPGGQLKFLCKNLNRTALHAQTLGFRHPRREEEMLFTSPWPEDLQPLLKYLNFL